MTVEEAFALVGRVLDGDKYLTFDDYMRVNEANAAIAFAAVTKQRWDAKRRPNQSQGSGDLTDDQLAELAEAGATYPQTLGNDRDEPVPFDGDEPQYDRRIGFTGIPPQPDRRSWLDKHNPLR